MKKNKDIYKNEILLFSYLQYLIVVEVISEVVLDRLSLSGR